MTLRILLFEWVKTLWSRQNRTRLDLIVSSSRLQRERDGLRSLVCLQTVRWEPTKHPPTGCCKQPPDHVQEGERGDGGGLIFWLVMVHY